ncbi:MAG: TonB-dependent receptor plug domain-containing protein [Flavobacteriales bacterium]
MNKLLLCLILPVCALSQDTILISNSIPEIIFFENKKEEERLYNPQQIIELDQKKIVSLLPSTTADVLQKSGEVSVQMSQSGGGSPIIRGFEANRVLLVIDGVRMNNAIFRSGHLQNSISTSPFLLNKMDVIFGPASVKYGSDALGGVINIQTKTPQKTEKSIHHFNQKYSSVNQGVTLHYDINWTSNEKWSFLSGITLNKYGDLTMGSNRLHGYQDWGREPHITDGNIQLQTSYNQVDFLQKIRYDVSKNLSYLINIQYSNSTNIPRFDKLNDISNEQGKFEQWYYGPQKRFLSSISTQYDKKHLLFDQLNNITAFQEFNESRHSKKVGGMLNERFEKVFVLSNSTNFIKNIGYNSLSYGVDLQNNIVHSTASNSTTTRYADGGSEMNLLSVFAQYKIPYGQNSSYISSGVRLNKSILLANFLDTATFQLPFSQIKNDNNALTASLGWKNNLNNMWSFSTSLSSGFRSPNVDDLTKVFEKSGLVTVPNQNLKPEYSYNSEINITADYSTIDWNASAYYTILRDAIVKDEFILNGQDSLLYDGEYFPVVANTNAQEAHIYGFYTKLIWAISPKLKWVNVVNKTIGLNKYDESPLDHIPPLFAKSELQWKNKNNTVLFYTIYNDWKKASEYSANGSDNLNEATIDGNPSWWTLNLQFSSKISSKLNVQFAVENILDIHYKTYSSGISSPGRNFIVSLNSSF